MQSSQAAIARFKAFDAPIEDPVEMLDDQGRAVSKIEAAAELLLTKRGGGKVFTVRVELATASAMSFV